VTDLVPWRISGTYFESCNCDAICPCRTVGARPGGRSTTGVCFGALSWLVEEGRAGDVSLDGAEAALVFRYEDDEPGSPWEFVLHVDGHGEARAGEALAEILLGRAGGDAVLNLPWVRKPAELVAVESSRIEIEHGPGGHDLKVGDTVRLRASRAFETAERVSCVIPGHHIAGTELYADELSAADGRFAWELEGNCAFLSSFDYASDS
jgi:hypothetical protein